MSNSIRSLVLDAKASESFVRLRPSWSPIRSEGYVIGVGEEWLLLHVINPEVVRFNGYEAFRVNDLVEAVANDRSVIHRVLRQRKHFPRFQPDIFLDDTVGLLSSINTHFPLITLHTERNDNGVCYIGRVEKLGKKRVTLAEISPSATWKYSRKYRYEDITRIGFADGYQNALWELGQSGWRERQAMRHLLTPAETEMEEPA